MHLSFSVVVPGEFVGAITRGAAGKRSWAAHGDSTGVHIPWDIPREGQEQDKPDPGVEETQQSGLCSAEWCSVTG